MSDDEHAAGDTWTVAVTIPMSLPDELKDSLFHAIADAAYAWEPADRDGWDIDVVGAPIEAACDRWRRRAEQAEAYLADAIWIDPERCGGQPCIGGTRIPARLVAALAADAAEAALTAYPSLTPAQVELARWYHQRYGDAEQNRAAVERVRALRDDMRRITGARAWADRLDAALDPDQPEETQ